MENLGNITSPAFGVIALNCTSNRISYNENPSREDYVLSKLCVNGADWENMDMYYCVTAQL